MNDKQPILGKIVQHLIFHTSSMSDLGLLSGKMGVCIFFYRYARYTGIKRYDDFAGELLDEIYGETGTGIARDFENGLAGICWGIEYLSRNNFVYADTDDVLCNMDPLIVELDVRKIIDTSLERGLEGLAHYVLARCSGQSKLPIDSLYIAELKDNMNNKGCCPELTVKLDSLLKGEKVDYEFDLIDTIAARGTPKKKTPFTKAHLGISKNGLAGVALRMINESAG